ncbi:MarR family winged helix-turn-helix transcriptional regulator [Streptomyces sp. NPDC096311]|uniref:MarR family winged helix-turn-helix transcriptional regulator n=1 Tax=Streptomyces sp. NPDC096311 TaxID=3366083 RepID=UPI0037FA77B7
MHRILAGQLLRQVGLHPSQELVMMELWERGRLRQVDLAKLLDADPPTVTRTVRRLEQAGFVRRIPSPTDKRSILVEPTVASLALREKVGKLWLELEDLGTEGVGEDERMQTLMVLDRFEQNLARHKTQDAGHPDTEDPA